jgi:uncharacterized coiled-coil DUF342 family protein
MELAIAVLAVILAAVAIWLVLPLRGAFAEVGELRRADGDLRRELERLQAELSQLHGQLDQTQSELDELKAATDIAPVPPLPKARSGHLEDLREQLRAAHRETEESSEE